MAAAVLVLALAGGFAWRGRDGRLKEARKQVLTVADRLDLVRRLDIRRTPTVFVLGPQGEIARRASGLPRRDQVMAAVALASGETAAHIGRDSEHGLA